MASICRRGRDRARPGLYAAADVSAVEDSSRQTTISGSSVL